MHTALRSDDEAPLVARSHLIRFVTRQLDGLLPEDQRRRIWTQVLDARGERLVVDIKGCGVRAPRGEWVSFEKSPTQWSLLETLVSIRSQQATLAPFELVARIWPDMHFVGRSGLNRLHKTISLVRSKGFGDLIECLEEGYRLNPSIEVKILPLAGAWTRPPE